MTGQMTLVAPTTDEIVAVFRAGEWLSLVEIRERLALPSSLFTASSAALAGAVLRGPFERRRRGWVEIEFRPARGPKQEPSA